LINTTHKDKLLAAIDNPKCKADKDILKEALAAYQEWIQKLDALHSEGKQKVLEMTNFLNEYKNYLEVDLIAKRCSPFIKRQKGQLKLDNSVIEEFLARLISPSVIKGLPTNFQLEVGPQTAFMSLSFRPVSMQTLNDKPDIVIKLKDQDFTIGKTIYYKFSPDVSFNDAKTEKGSLFLAVLAAECKVNLDKTMFQEAAGTATRLKQGCPNSKYYVLVEYLDMTPEDCRLTDIDNVLLLRHARRLPFEKRDVYEEIRNQHRDFPIDGEVIYRFVEEIQSFLGSVWYNPEAALKRGSFI
jgi:hypothetical protein